MKWFSVIFSLILMILFVSCDNSTTNNNHTGSMLIHVISSETYEPIKGAEVRTIPFVDASITHKGGIAELSYIKSGTYVVSAEAKGYYINYKAVKIAQEEVKEIEIQLSRIEENNNEPMSPFNEMPKSGSVITAGVVNFTWYCSDPDKDSIFYEFLIGKNELPHQVLSSSLSIPSYNINELEPGHKYYWRLICRDENNAATLGDIWDFTIE